MSAHQLDLQPDVRLSSLTTLGVGGPARFLVEVVDEDQLQRALQFAADRDIDSFILGGGSNLVISDAGYDGLVVRLVNHQLRISKQGESTLVQADAGVDWDHLVEVAVRQNLAGVECLSGIPGTVGASPIQNIGAYGGEVAQVIRAVRVMDRSTGVVQEKSGDDCGFGYRTSHFKRRWRGRYVITRVDFELMAEGRPALRYEQLARRIDTLYDTKDPSLDQVRKAVLAIRREKSMLADKADPNGFSVGSFFINPVVDSVVADRLEDQLDLSRTGGMPRYPASAGMTKLSAAWLIERAGFPRGYEFGGAGLSSRHALAIINRGEARAEEIIALALRIRNEVHALFGVWLMPEPTFLGFGEELTELYEVREGT